MELQKPLRPVLIPFTLHVINGSRPEADNNVVFHQELALQFLEEESSVMMDKSRHINGFVFPGYLVYPVKLSAGKPFFLAVPVIQSSELFS